MLFKDFNERMDEIVLICIVNAHVKPLSRTFLKKLNERCLFRWVLVVTDFED